MKCINCDTLLPEGEAYCPKCGYKHFLPYEDTEFTSRFPNASKPVFQPTSPGPDIDMGKVAAKAAEKMFKPNPLITKAAEKIKEGLEKKEETEAAEEPAAEEVAEPAAQVAEEKVEVAPEVAEPTSKAAAPAPVAAAPVVASAPLASSNQPVARPPMASSNSVVAKPPKTQSNSGYSDGSTKKGGKGLAVTAYVLYAIALIMLVGVLALLAAKNSSDEDDRSNRPNGGFVTILGGSDEDTTSGGNTGIIVNPGGTINPGGTTSKPSTSNGPHDGYTDLDDEAASDLVNFYTQYAMFGICPGDSTSLSDSETEQLFREMGWDPEYISAYSTFYMDNCHSTAEADSHIKLYITDRMFNTCDPPRDTNNLMDAVSFDHDGRLYFVIGNMGWDSIYYVDGSLYQEGDVWYGAYAQHYEEGIAGTLVFVKEDGVFKLADVK